MAKQQPTNWIETDKVLPPEGEVVEAQHSNGKVRRLYVEDGVWRRAKTRGAVLFAPFVWRYRT